GHTEHAQPRGAEGSELRAQHLARAIVQRRRLAIVVVALTARENCLRRAFGDDQTLLASLKNNGLPPAHEVEGYLVELHPFGVASRACMQNRGVERTPDA